MIERGKLKYIDIHVTAMEGDIYSFYKEQLAPNMIKEI